MYYKINYTAVQLKLFYCFNLMSFFSNCKYYMYDQYLPASPNMMFTFLPQYVYSSSSYTVHSFHSMASTDPCMIKF